MVSVTSGSRVETAMALNYISALAPIASATYSQELFVITKVVKVIETLSRENYTRSRVLKWKAHTSK